MTHKDNLEKLVSGDVYDDKGHLAPVSKDTSLFTVEPSLLVVPKERKDIREVVTYVDTQKTEDPTLSVTARAAGSDMTGGSLNDSVIVSYTEHLNTFKVKGDDTEVTVEPGVFFRDLEPELKKRKIMLPPYPASKSLAALGGMIMNNCAGELTLRYGQMRNFVNELTMILRDGQEYTFGPLSKQELESKMQQSDLEGEIYRKMFSLIDENYEHIQSARPAVAKNSSGYALWDVYDRESGTFNLAQLFVGSQGTLGLMTEAKLRLVPETPHKKLVVIFLKSWDDIPDIVNSVLPFEPEGLETFDADTLMLGLRFMPEIAAKVGEPLIAFAARFWPEALIGAQMMQMPKVTILVQLAEDDPVVLEKKTRGLSEMLKTKRAWSRVASSEADAEKYWTMRRESFALLRKHSQDKRTAPFVDDSCVAPEHVPEFLPKALEILKNAGIRANIAGHAGSGNFHIIPLMDFTKPGEKEKILSVSDEFYDLVAKYKGTITAEHNDGIIRTPYLSKIFDPRTLNLFREVKNIFDPQNIFNPGKKVGGTKEAIAKYLTG